MTQAVVDSKTQRFAGFIRTAEKKRRAVTSQTTEAEKKAEQSRMRKLRARQYIELIEIGQEIRKHGYSPYGKMISNGYCHQTKSMKNRGV